MYLIFYIILKLLYPKFFHFSLPYLRYKDLRIHAKTKLYSLKYSKSRKNQPRFFTGNQGFHRKQLLRYDSQMKTRVSAFIWGTRRKVSGRLDRASHTKPKFVQTSPPPPLPVSSPHLFVIIARDIILLKAI